MKHFTKEEQKKYTESIRKVFTLPEEYLRRADEKLPSDSKELKKDYLKLRSENTLLGERCNQLLTDKGKLTDRVQELEESLEKLQKSSFNMIDKKNNRIAVLEEENAELKEKYVKNITDCDICDTYCNSQLTKAKELLNRFIETSNPIYFEEDRQKVKAEAEQFLSEVEK